MASIKDEHKNELREMIRWYGVAGLMGGLEEVVRDATSTYVEDAIIHDHLPHVEACAAACRQTTISRVQIRLSSLV